MRTDTPLIFLHIPRTAGTTLTRILTRQFKKSEVFSAIPAHDASASRQFAALPDEVRRRTRLLLVGHEEFRADADLPTPATYVSLVRDPVQRVISTYRFLHDHPRDPLYESVVGGGMSLVEFVESGLATTLNDWQARAIAGEPPSVEPCPPDVLDRAIGNIENRFALVGVSEQFPETVVALGRIFDWHRLHYSPLNVSQAPLRVSQKDERLIRELNAVDCSLYDFAVSRLRRQLAAYPSTDQDLRRLDRGNRFYAPVDRAYDAARRLRHTARLLARPPRGYSP
jgi:hypothetical protein